MLRSTYRLLMRIDINNRHKSFFSLSYNSFSDASAIFHYTVRSLRFSLSLFISLHTMSPDSFILSLQVLLNVYRVMGSSSRRSRYFPIYALWLSIHRRQSLLDIIVAFLGDPNIPSDTYFRREAALRDENIVSRFLEIPFVILLIVFEYITWSSKVSAGIAR